MSVKGVSVQSQIAMDNIERTFNRLEAISKAVGVVHGKEYVISREQHQRQRELLEEYGVREGGAITVVVHNHP